jgi:hypothetical protein
VPGPTGATGPVGATGPSGTAGVNGATGATGPSGIDGVTGPTGPTGPSGTAGAAGATGATGPTGAAGAAAAVSYSYSATAGQTTFSGSDLNSLTLAYTVGAEQVYLNGVLLVRTTDYTATNGTSVVLALAATLSDTLVVVAYGAFNVANTYTQAEADARYPLNTSSLFAGKNKIINGDFGVWQRGTSVALAASTPGYAADRWYIVNGANQATTVSRQATGDTTNLPFIQYCSRVQRNSGQTGTGTMSISQPFETVNSVSFAGKTVTFSFYARKGANYSATSDVLTVYLITGTGTDQNQQGAGYTGQTLAINQSATLTTTWQRFTQSVTLGTGITEIQPVLTYTPTGTAGAADYFEITGMQLEAGSVATAFQTATGTIQGELAACQRYYYRTTATTLYQRFTPSSPAASATNIYAASFFLPVQMRVKPTVIDFSNLIWYDGVSVGNAISALTLSTDGTAINAALDIISTGMTQYRPINLMSGTTSGYLGVGAEL